MKIEVIISIFGQSIQKRSFIADGFWGNIVDRNKTNRAQIQYWYNAYTERPINE